MKEVILPEGFPPGTPLSYFKSRLDEYCIIYTVEDMYIVNRVIKKTPEMFQFFSLIENKMKTLLKRVESGFDDLRIIIAALELIEFLDENSAAIKVHFNIAADLIACLMMYIYKLSDNLKNKNLDIIPDTGWQLFDLLAKLLSKNENVASRSPYLLLQLAMQPRIIDEIRFQMRSVLQQMHDTELNIRDDSDEELRHPVFRKDPQLRSRVVQLQNDIEKCIAEDDSFGAEKLSTQLRGIIKKNDLKVSFNDTHYFCSTVNNYHSLHKLRRIIEMARSFSNLSLSGRRTEFLQCLVQIGEYMSNRKLSTKFRESFTGIPWDAYQVIRDCLSHPEDGKNAEITESLLDGALQARGVSLSLLQSELSDLDKAIADVIEVRFSVPNAQFFNEYLDRYQEESIAACSLEDQQFFLENLTSDNPVLVNQWREVLSGQCLLPKKNPELSTLKSVVFVPKVLNAPLRKRLNDIVNNLSDKSTREEIEFLKKGLDFSLLSENDRGIFSQIGTRGMTGKEKEALRKCIPKPDYGADTLKNIRINEILQQREDVRDKGSRILYPRQNKIFEKTPLYKSNESRWSILIKDKAVCPTIDEYFELCRLIDSELPGVDFSLRLVDIFDKIRVQFEIRLRRQWCGRMPSSQLERFLAILSENPSITQKWYKVLHQEIPYPDGQGFIQDLKVVREQSHQRAEEFVRLTRLLKPIICNVPAAVMLKDVFVAGYKKSSGALAVKSVVEKKRICSIAITEISAMSSIMLEELFGEAFSQGIMEDIVGPSSNAAIHKVASINPSFQRFLKARQSIFAEVEAEARRTGKEVRVPLEYIWGLHRQMVVEDPREADIEKALFDGVELSIKQAFKDQHEYELPKQIKRNTEFRLALEFHLTRCLSLLKKIIKFADPKDAEFLFDNYLTLKKYRNDLIHGDYVRESLDKDLKENTAFLAKFVDIIKHELQAILQKLDREQTLEVPPISIIDKILSLIGENNNDTKQFGGVHVERGEVGYAICDANNYYTADFINLLHCYRLSLEKTAVKAYPATTVDEIEGFFPQIFLQDENYAFIPLNVAYDEKEPRHKNHWVALVVDKKNKLIFYLDPAQRTNHHIPTVIANLREKLGYPMDIIVNPIDFQQKEKEEGWVRHCGVYVVEIFNIFEKHIRANRCILDELPRDDMEDHGSAISVQSALSIIPCGEVENIVKIRKNHIEHLGFILGVNAAAPALPVERVENFVDSDASLINILGIRADNLISAGAKASTNQYSDLKSIMKL